MTMKYFFWIVIFAFLASACDQTTVREEYNEDGVVMARYTCLSKTGERHGAYEIFHEDGYLYEAGTYTRDTLDGERTIFYPNGTPNIIEYYEGGTIKGPYKVYHPNGQLEVDGAFVDGRIEGTWKVYYENGQLKEIVAFVNNEENGPFIEYYPNGNLKAEGTYVNGDNEDGELKLYNEEGILVRIMLCANGLCRTTWSIEENGESANE